MGAEARDNLYRRHLELGVLPDGTAFRGEENRQEFLTNPPTGINQPFMQANPTPGPSNPPPQPAADLGEEDDQEEEEETQAPPNRLISKASNDPSKPLEEQPDPPTENEPELSEKFVSDALDAIQQVLNLTDIYGQEQELVFLAEDGLSVRIPTDDLLEYLSEIKQYAPTSAVSYSEGAYNAAKDLSDLVPNVHEMREEYRDALIHSEEVPMEKIDMAIDFFIVQSVTDMFQEAIMPEKKARREEALNERIKRLAQPILEENGSDSGGQDIE